MKLLIFGSTGSVGIHLVNQTLEEGHIVTAFARDASKVTEKNKNLHVVEGDVLNPESVEKAMKDQDAVLCSLGAGRKGDIRSKGTQNIIKAMEKTGIRRFICQSTLGVGDSRDNLNFFWKYIMFGFFIRPAYIDHVNQENHVRQSNLDWTIIRPAAFTDGEHTGDQYRYGFQGADKNLKLKISRADVADFMLKQLKDNSNLHKTPGLSY